MDFETFLQNFSDQFSSTDVSTFNADTVIKELDEWSSLVALSIVAMVDEEYDVSLSRADIKSVSTIGDLFEIVKSKVK